MKSLSRDQRPDGLNDRQYELYQFLAFNLQIPYWPQEVRNSFGSETLSFDITRGYVAQWIRETPLADVEAKVEAAISQVCDKAWEDTETPECPNCGSLGRVASSSLGGEGCEWYCYKCCHTF
ncbi:hypothetical protein GW933_00740 [Candidatus Falkowbacteria bacterium]|nr:hypothetical protein [Candidatus Falkowbacteria bacterium]